ncbi:sarcoglycan delta isoform X2 [Rhodnius prolixus]|uniref:sarcoglycan delta isoform X2 n=1 Tax=Rhodnius prolixus TaxID=13249 RepID=UPI003D18DF5A
MEEKTELTQIAKFFCIRFGPNKTFLFLLSREIHFWHVLAELAANFLLKTPLERIKLASTLPHRQALVVGDRAHWTTTLPANHHVPLDHRNVKGLSINGAKQRIKMCESTDFRERGGGTSDSGGPHIGIYGWRKRCLYLLILTLLVLVILNLALTLWVLKVMEFNTEGMGNVRIVEGGLEVSGQSFILGNLIASTIRSKPGQPINFRASHNISFTTEYHGHNTLTLGRDKLEAKASRFKVNDLQGRTLFSADKNEVVIGADLLRLSGSGGVVFDGSLQTPLVRASPGSDLNLESPTRSLHVMAPGGISIESRAGDISASCLTDLTLHSLDGAIRLEASKVMLPGLKMAHPRPQPRGRPPAPPPAPVVFQLCSCHNGKLFLAPAEGLCATDNENALCR